MRCVYSFQYRIRQGHIFICRTIESSTAPELDSLKSCTKNQLWHPSSPLPSTNNNECMVLCCCAILAQQHQNYWFHWIISIFILYYIYFLLWDATINTVVQTLKRYGWMIESRDRDQSEPIYAVKLISELMLLPLWQERSFKISLEQICKVKQTFT